MKGQRAVQQHGELRVKLAIKTKDAVTARPACVMRVVVKCQARHRGWTNADNPFVVHRRISPQCQHLAQLSVEPAAISAVHNDVTDSSARHRTIFSGLDTDNTEDGEPRVSTGQPQSVSIDETGNTEDGEPRLANGQPQSVSIDETGNNTQTAATGHSATSQGATSRSGAPGQATVVRTMFPSPALDLGGAVYPMYQDMASRRRSFVNWNETRAPPLEEILLNGMFYAGYADCVRCFYCGVGLKSWEPTDNVWSEHIRWRPNCRYLQAIKGEDYIRRVVTQLNREGDGEDLREAVSTVRSDNFVLPARPSITTPLTTATISTTSSTPVPAASQPALASSLSSPTSQLAATATIQPETTAATGLSQEQRNNVDRVEEDGEARPSRISVVPPNGK
ncbi:hypothetical protein C0Q70_10530 [Pomacea canaliculata]|uniref:Uncharacterized protein n=1 Tax=Pomacea canaliculata TaxID=400727 RepID=A0A2T7P3F0_POMCA|nr:hypothetical protein C0Q70_10530 [Pomacea canaliculata]